MIGSGIGGLTTAALMAKVKIKKKILFLKMFILITVVLVFCQSFTSFFHVLSLKFTNIHNDTGRLCKNKDDLCKMSDYVGVKTSLVRWRIMKDDIQIIKGDICTFEDDIRSIKDDILCSSGVVSRPGRKCWCWSSTTRRGAAATHS